MISNASEFGQMVARARKALGIPQRELALAINAGERFIVDLEAGKPTAQLGKALAAARAAGVRLKDVSGKGFDTARR
ncbi:MAG: DNA-binding protein [Hyphomonas sp.]|jgi:ribosome-binding protein aMBF1 (putative translation factor)|uniref:helix-turn-helix domain-containing protein n=1 Tax=Hyphomonas sp. TaxID=87 RepID=UPI001D3E5CFD|nr:helix-turn-helix domain-containing protein [Hyphomonas sp.]MBA4228248.1 DNA-binding protein [Hyphomonas sp.]